MCLRFVLQYAGKWYEIRRLYDPDEVELEDCVQEQYTLAENKLDFEILRAVQQGPTGEVVYSTGIATPKVFHNTKVPQFIMRYNTTDPADPGECLNSVCEINSRAVANVHLSAARGNK